MSISWPYRISLASLTTPFHLLKRWSTRYKTTRIWIKRDDLTGSLLSGNKVRKLEFTVAHALHLGHDFLITCGGLQSNHCRATAFTGAQLGIPVHLVLRGDEPAGADGNLLLDKLAGATISYHKPLDYQQYLPQLLNNTADEYKQRGFKPYIIPTGASDGLGVWGYFAACQELKQDFIAQRIIPEALVVATGSGGTQAGLTLGSAYFALGCQVTGIAVCDSENYFQQKVSQDIHDFIRGFGDKIPEIEGLEYNVQTNDQYIGEGYGKASAAVLNVICELARIEGILLDPVYTGKAFYGLDTEIRQGQWQGVSDIVFVHTGGTYGLFPYRHVIEQQLMGM